MIRECSCLDGRLLRPNSNIAEFKVNLSTRSLVHSVSKPALHIPFLDMPFKFKAPSKLKGLFGSSEKRKKTQAHEAAGAQTDVTQR